MKIIAKTSGGFLLDASESELANLMGYWSSCSTRGNQQLSNWFTIGREFNVSKMYGYLTELTKAKRQMEDCKKTMLALANLMNLPEPVIEAATIIKEGE